MLTTHAADQTAADGRLPSGEGLRMVPLADDYRPALQVMAGVFARRGERGNYHSAHPLNLLWQAFEERARSTRHADVSAARTNES